MTRAALTEAAMVRAINAARKAGHTGPIEFLPDGTIRLLPESAKPAKPAKLEPEAW